MKYGTLVRLSNADEAASKFATLAENRLEACQLIYKPENFTLEAARSIKAAAEKAGIEISAQFVGYRDNYCSWDMRYDFINAGINSPLFGGRRIEYVLSAIPFVKELGITDVIIHAGHISTDPFSENYTRMLSAVGLIAARLKEAGLNLLFETGPEAPISLLRLITEVGTGNLFVNLDTANIIMYGCGNPVDALTTVGKYVRNTHFKDGLPPTEPYKLGREVTIGEGNVDFPRVVKLLKGLGYDRYITIEREISGDGSDILKAVGYIKRIWNNE